MQHHARGRVVSSGNCCRRTILNEYCALMDLVDREAVSALAQVWGL
jgi:hypothetical protein